MLKPLGALTIAFAVAALPWSADAQSTTKYDGGYAGVSRDNLSETAHNECTHGGNPYTLTITNGTATMPWGKDGSIQGGTLQGTVSPTGALVMSGWSGSVSVHVNGQIDPNGSVTAQVATGGCGYRMTWKKQ